jgi:hypothetical protein
VKVRRPSVQVMSTTSLGRTTTPLDDCCTIGTRYQHTPAPGSGLIHAWPVRDLCSLPPAMHAMAMNALNRPAANRSIREPDRTCRRPSAPATALLCTCRL